MKTTVLALATTLSLSLAAVAPAMAEDLEFMLINTSGVDITAFHVSDAGSESWEDDLLDGAILPDGHEVGVIITDGLTTCDYDIRTEFADGDVYEDYGLNLCEMGSYTF
ncbi:hypothetical protein [Roseospira visakhapatnamensis]|uniref:Argininosuccinate lyase n=1 Tax=Roseospira visakhapatnamensis TaxID=390880 RepID=A0A7W6RCU2_9PROT|nr:hypothetical protein [Roseospira visakhapatnamensis]MBB4266077.1 hypothetical protein [Roseospira visakhapatnamensis]